MQGKEGRKKRGQFREKKKGHLIFVKKGEDIRPGSTELKKIGKKWTEIRS